MTTAPTPCTGSIDPRTGGGCSSPCSGRTGTGPGSAGRSGERTCKRTRDSIPSSASSRTARNSGRSFRRSFGPRRWPSGGDPRCGAAPGRRSRKPAEVVADPQARPNGLFIGYEHPGTAPWKGDRPDQAGGDTRNRCAWPPPSSASTPRRSSSSTATPGEITRSGVSASSSEKVGCLFAFSLNGRRFSPTVSEARQPVPIARVRGFPSSRRR
jgi:hypothetical protein